MKKLLTLLLVTSVTFSFAQKKQKDTAKVHLPLKEGAIFFETIIDSLPGKKAELFNTSLKWMANSFKDSKEVIQLKDPETGTIVGAGNLVLFIPGFIETHDFISFRTELTVKDNKTRLRLYQFSNKPIGYKYDFSPMDGKYQEYLAQKQFPKANRKYYEQFELIINNLLQSYVVFIKEKSKPDDF